MKNEEFKQNIPGKLTAPPIFSLRNQTSTFD